MDEVKKTTSNISDSISNILIALIDNIGTVVSDISVELSNVFRIIGFDISLSLVKFIDDIFLLYSDEWTIAQKLLFDLDNRINSFVANRLKNINIIIDQFNNFTDMLINNFAEELKQIDDSINPYFTQRMFEIYNYIAEFSKALNVPPFYLEGIINNAKTFAMGVACNNGTPYYEFKLNWNFELEKLLIHINNSVELYRTNPQWLKEDIEQFLIKPLFEATTIKRNNAKELLTNTINSISNLENIVFDDEARLSEITQAMDSFYAFKVEPALSEIKDNFDIWVKDDYKVNMKGVRNSFILMISDYIEVFSKVAKIFLLLDYPADILLRVNKLSDKLRIEQEDKIGEVTTRSFKRLVPEWLNQIDESTG